MTKDLRHQCVAWQHTGALRPEDVARSRPRTGRGDRKVTYAADGLFVYEKVQDEPGPVFYQLSAYDADGNEVGRGRPEAMA